MLETWRFTVERASESVRFAGDLIPLHFAVAASSAFPPLFPPIKMTKEHVAANDAEFPYPMALTDGGVYDNLGYKKFSILDAAQRTASTCVILSDGSGAFHPDVSKTYRSMIARNVRATDILMRRVGEETLRTALLAERRSAVHVSIGSVRPGRRLPEAIQRRFQAIRTDLDRFTPDEIMSLMVHGYEVCSDALGANVGPSPLLTKWSDALPGTDQNLDRILKRAARRRYGLLNFWDWTSYALLLLMVVLPMGVAGASFWVIRTRSEVAQLNETVSVKENRIENLAQQVNSAIQASAVPLSPSADPPPVASINRSEYTVWIQFAGSLRREQMIDLGRQIAANWTVPGANRGGERIGAAAGLNEIRFGPSSDEAAARLLAVEVAQTSIVSGRPSIRRVPSIPPKSLELWISR